MQLGKMMQQRTKIRLNSEEIDMLILQAARRQQPMSLTCSGRPTRDHIAHNISKDRFAHPCTVPLSLVAAAAIAKPYDTSVDWHSARAVLLRKNPRRCLRLLSGVLRMLSVNWEPKDRVNEAACWHRQSRRGADGACTKTSLVLLRYPRKTASTYVVTTCAKMSGLVGRSERHWKYCFW